EMEGVINASGQWKYSFYTGHKFTTPKEAKNKVYMHSIESRRNLKLYKNDGVRIRASCEGKVLVFTMSQGTGPTDPNHGMEAEPSGSSGPTTRSKKRKNTGTNDDSQASPSFLDAHGKRDLCPWVLEIKHCTYKLLSEKIFEQVRVNPNIPVKAVQDQLQRKMEVQISMSKAFKAKAKAEREIRGDHIAVERNTDPSLHSRVFKRIYVCLGALKLGFKAFKRVMLGLDGAFMKGPFPGQVLVAVGLDSNNGIYPLAYALVEAETKSSWCWFLQCLGDDIDLHPNSNFTFISDRQKVFNGKIVRGRDKPVITLLEYIREYCMKRIVNVQGVIDKCTGPLTSTTTRIMESIKKEAHLIKELTGIPCKHVVASCWNMALNDRAAPPPENWVNPYYWLSTWKDTYSYKIQPICGTKYWEKSTCTTTLLPPNHHVQVGRPKKKRKRSKHKDEPFVKDSRLSRKGRTITCQSCGNTGHNKTTCKGQGSNNAEASGSATGQAQQIEPAVGQDGSGGSSAGVVIGLSVAAGECGAGVAS
ncbi:heat stress transcription factor B-4-like protein, partial [Tanacetum coccineum]